MKKIYLGSTALFAATLYTQTAAAHTGVHDIAGFASGLAHPFLGLDHTLAMLAVGLWAVLPGRRGAAVAVLPLLFMTSMAMGGWLGANGAVLPYLENGIALSVAILGGLILARWQWSLLAASALVMMFGGLHGYAHGLESAGSAEFIGYALGFTLATGMLHLLGMGLGWAMVRSPWLDRLCGAGIGAAGLILLAQTF
ncbi:HupE/UreJ family protein [Methylomagnum sp.]